jgi:hypothetical protein
MRDGYAHVVMLVDDLAETIVKLKKQGVEVAWGPR